MEGVINQSASSTRGLGLRYASAVQPLLPPQIQRVIEEFSKLPGIGAKSAERLTFYLLRSSKAEPEAMSRVLRELKEGIHYCTVCQMVAVDDLCPVCCDTSRDHSLVLVVEEPLACDSSVALIVNETSLGQAAALMLAGP